MLLLFPSLSLGETQGSLRAISGQFCMINHVPKEEGEEKKYIPFTLRALRIHVERDQRGQTKK